MADGPRVRIRVLGPLRVTAPDGRDLTPSGALQRRMLALLVLRRGRTVSTDVAIDALWPGGSPADPVAALQNHVSRLRRAVDPLRIESLDTGYRLDPADVTVDADELAAAVAADDPATVGIDLDDLLARWSGPYPELIDLDDARPEVVRLEELHLRARERRAERRLPAGELDGLVAELSTLVEVDPFREGPRLLLMRALDASGRRVEALRAFDDHRRLLAAELGLEPSPTITAEHARLLGIDAGPDAPAAGPSGAPGSPRPTIPRPASSLVGRDALVDRVLDLGRERRLVSLVGPGGVGKTRLLLEVGHRLASAAPDQRVALCELASADPASAGHAVARSLGIDARPDVPLAEQLASVLGRDAIVLLLDNCEHVLDALAPLVEHLLGRCPNLRVLTTTRERLRVPGEQVCPVPVLPADGPDAAAVQLFLDRAATAAPAFRPDPADLDLVASITARLDGLPLAIELAAARLFTHDLHELADGLDRGFTLLSAGSRTSPRHESLGAAISWSYDGLDERLRRVFTALSAFAAPFSVADTAAVCELDVATAEAALTDLVERSLVVRTSDRRHALLETLREFGAERLDHAGEGPAVRARHARHMVSRVVDADRRLAVPGEHAIAEIDALLPELHLALGRLLDSGAVDDASDLVAALRDYSFMRLRPDVAAWAERVTAVDPGGRSPSSPLVWGVAAYAAWMAGDVPECGRRAEVARVLSERHHGHIRSEVSGIVANHHLFEGRLDEAVTWYQLAIDTSGDDPAQRWFVTATMALALGYARDPSAAGCAQRVLDAIGHEETPYAAYAWYCAGEANLAVDAARPVEHFERSLEIAQRTGASLVTGIAGASKASIVARVGDPEQAASEYRWLIDHWRRAGMWSTQWTMLRSIAGLLARLGRSDEAAVLVGAVTATGAGHRIFGADAVALRELGTSLRATLGDPRYEQRLAEGAALDGDAAVEHALRSLL